MQSHITKVLSGLRPLLAGLAIMAVAPVALAQDFVWAPDFPAGSELPAISAPDQDGNLQTFDDLAGENGLLFMLSRSFDW